MERKGLVAALLAGVMILPYGVGQIYTGLTTGSWATAFWGFLGSFLGFGLFFILIVLALEVLDDYL